MASQITNYQCPACTGPLHYVGESGKLECDYCGSKFSVQEIEALYQEKDEAAAAASTAAQQQQQAEAESGGNWAQDAGIRVYVCPSCGAELICDETTAATACPYCNNPSIVPGQLSDMLKPDYVIPFKLGKEQAMKALRNYYRGKKLLPGSFSEENHIEEIKGVYVPFWLFDGTVDADMRFQGTRVNSVTTGNEIITTTDYYRICRAGDVDFEKIPVNASSKMPDAHMDAIEPYDYAELKPFSNAYLPGFLADKYDVEPEACRARAEARAQNTAAELIASTVSGYSSCTPESRRLDVRPGRYRYALLPVWLLATKYEDKNYLFAMNGQTGKLIGDLPVSKGKMLALFAGIAAPFMALLAYLLY